LLDLIRYFAFGAGELRVVIGGKPNELEARLAAGDDALVLIVGFDIDHFAGNSRTMLDRRFTGSVVLPSRSTRPTIRQRTLTSRSVVDNVMESSEATIKHVSENGECIAAANDTLYSLQASCQYRFFHAQFHFYFPPRDRLPLPIYLQSESDSIYLNSFIYST
jgi:hypothetical protein